MVLLLYLLKLIFTEPCILCNCMNLPILIVLILKRRKNGDSYSLPNIYKLLVYHGKKLSSNNIEGSVIAFSLFLIAAMSSFLKVHFLVKSTFWGNVVLEQLCRFYLRLFHKNIVHCTEPFHTTDYFITETGVSLSSIIESKVV